MKRNLWLWLLMIIVFTLAIIACGGSDNRGSHSSRSTAANWISIGKTSTGYMYYDKNSIKKVNNNIIVETKKILNESRKTKSFSSFEGKDKAAENPDLISYMLVLNEIDCVNKKVKPVYSNTKYNDWDNITPNSVTKYNDWDNITPNSVTKYGEWYNITPDTVAEKLKNVVCGVPAAPQETVVVSKVEKPVTPKEAVVGATAVIDKNLTQVNSKQKETKTVQKLINKWITSWQSGNMKTYRSCYASDFQSKGMNLDAWISYKTNVRQKSKNINISIDDLQISADANIATAVFTQYYSSSIFKYSGKKKLELRKINDEWKIYREIM